MRDDDRAKILLMKENGMSVGDVCHRYRHRYKSEEVAEIFNKRRRGRPRKVYEDDDE